MLFISALLLIKPGLVTDLIGLGGLALVLGIQMKGTERRHGVNLQLFKVRVNGTLKNTL